MTFSHYESLARRLVLFLGLAAGALGCADAAPPEPSTLPTAPTAAPPVAPPPATGPLDPEAQLERLRALQLVTVGDLVMNLPNQAGACYGPCPADVQARQVAAETARQTRRLSLLADLAEQDARTIAAPSTELPSVDADLQALNDLAIVHLGGLLTVAPQSNPSCYNLPCGDDIAAARTENQRRAAVVHALAASAIASRL